MLSSVVYSLIVHFFVVLIALFGLKPETEFVEKNILIVDLMSVENIPLPPYKLPEIKTISRPLEAAEKLAFSMANILLREKDLEKMVFPKQKDRQKSPIPSGLKKDLLSRDRMSNLASSTFDTRMILNRDEGLVLSGNNLAPHEVSYLRQRFKLCWNVPAISEGLPPVVDIRVKVNRQGVIVDAQVIKKDYLEKNAIFRATAESALRAVSNPLCNRLKLSNKRYNLWKEMTLRFDASRIENEGKN